MEVHRQLTALFGWEFILAELDLLLKMQWDSGNSNKSLGRELHRGWDLALGVVYQSQGKYKWLINTIAGKSFRNSSSKYSARTIKIYFLGKQRMNISDKITCQRPHKL